MSNNNQDNIPGPIRILIQILISWFLSIIGLILVFIRQGIDWKEKEKLHKWKIKCRTYPSDLLLRPDVYIYSQKWLRSQGMAVTWNNPDIQLRKKSDGTIADSYNLLPDTLYDVEINVHNRSTMAPAVSVKVDCVTRSWGVDGQEQNPVGHTVVDVSVLGGAQNPALAVIPWRTPSEIGHYCLQVKLSPPDDLVWEDNEGQENTNVKSPNPGPGEEMNFIIPIFNNTEKEKKLLVAYDSYVLPDEPLPLSKQNAERMIGNVRTKQSYLGVLYRPQKPVTVKMKDEREKRRQEVIEANKEGKFPSPKEWQPQISDKEISIPKNSKKEITFSVFVPRGTRSGEEQTFNVYAKDDSGRPLGGVTLVVKV